jgi:cobalamin-dependent methionine synthase I
VLNGVFLAMAIAAGMTCAITNPIEHEIKQAIMAADVMMGHDENCADWLKFVRALPPPEAKAAMPATAAAPAGNDARDVSAERAAREARRAARRGSSN